MKTRKIIYLLLNIMIFSLFGKSYTIAQYQIVKSVISNGGGKIANSNNQISNTLGQPLIGLASNATYQNKLGFWYSGPVTARDTITWQTNLIVTDAGSGSGILIFGQAATATDGLDISLGEAELPPTPPVGIFDVRFQLPILNPIYSLKDYRFDGNETAIWKFKFQPSTAGYPIKIRWNIAELPPGNFVIKDEITRNIVRVDMKKVDNVVIPNSAISSLLIEMTKVTWKANLVVADAGNNSMTLTFGQAPGAIDGLDPSLGEAELPPPPPPGVIDARFELPGATIYSLKDFRSDADKTIRWRLKFQPGSGGFPITLSWNISELPCTNGFYLKDELTGKLINIDMKNQNGYKITNSAFTSLIIEMTSEIIREVKVLTGWNLISVPLLAADMSVKALFANAASFAFRFDNGYVVEDTLTNGIGYWLKFNKADTIQISGQPISDRRIAVKAGWNIIGPLESDVMISEIISEPAGIVQSDYFEFNNGYRIVTKLQVGKGYWVKVSQSGTLNIPVKNILNKQDLPIIADSYQELLAKLPRLIFEDNYGQSRSLYLGFQDQAVQHSELPPIPPTGIFDVRYMSGRYLESLSQAGVEIQLSSARYPVKIRAENLNDYLLRARDMIDGRVFDQTVAEAEEIELSQPLTGLLLTAQQRTSIRPITYQLQQNYPNPFNPTTLIKFALPENGHVSIQLYNIQGKKIIDLVDAHLPAGLHQVEVNAQELASGVYFYVMKSGHFSSVKKMVVMK